MTVRTRYLDASGQVRAGRVESTAAGGIRILADPAGDALAPTGGLVTGGLVTGHFTDWHVHLQLIEPSELGAGAIGRVLDLGGAPEVVASYREEARGTSANTELHVDFAGAFLTAPGGYPSDRAWAPAGSFRELRTVADAENAVAEMARLGASHIKVASNQTAGPVLSAELFRAVVEAARRAQLPVVAHAEGTGEAMRVFELGATWFAHTPFSERLSDSELRVLAANTTWISTLDVHGWGTPDEAYAIARDNLAGFVRLGGSVKYGTDLGNGPLPTSLNARELAALREAGLSAHAQLAALTPADPTQADTRLLFVPEDAAGELDIAAARPLTLSDITDPGDLR